MEGRRNHRLSIGGLSVALVLSLMAIQAAADDAEQARYRNKRLSTATVYTTPNAAVVEADSAGGVSTASSVKATRRKQCRLEPVLANVTSSNVDIYAAHQGETDFFLYCDGQYVGLVWRKLDPEPRAGISMTPGDVAEHLRDEIPMPKVNVRINPDVGLVGAESWFWIEGYSGEAITNSTDAFGRAVEVEARAIHYEWFFGDGSTAAATTPGTAYPERSQIRHVFQRASSGGYGIDVRFTFTVRYRVDGGAWIELPGISRTATAIYRVRESQAVISK